MTSARLPWVALALGGAVLCGGLLTRASAQTNNGLNLIKGGSTPAAINGIKTFGNSCPLLVKPEDAALQPLPIAPAQVAAKNQLGCLSAADAIYGADGCPSKLCGAGKGVIPLPADVSPNRPQLPEP
jgi:hypothetical protein